MEQDGMDDLWEDAYGLDPNVRDGDGDLDGDGLSNLEEFLLGQDPSRSPPACGCNSGSHTASVWGVFLGLVALIRRCRERAS